ncbi:hybrid sensor histidine kinase/response regulator [Cohnella massiliensis]|uniref:hybrid sensor histidine kinase/response regulator n=1 Tax=Cohnella massiliensis TaxID=1816691 RepID=UPI001FE924B9|nr:ATP-binding protein [Cohnella massiliensis]
MPTERTRISAKWKTLAILGLFLILLAGLRLIWIGWFHHEDQPHAANGLLDLRNWDAGAGRTVTLDGEWEFYPHVWLMDGDDPTAASDQGQPSAIQVPGAWNASLRPGEETPYGYGSYRLRILVDPESEATYSIRIPSVRSASALYVDGRLLAKSGEPAESAREFVPYNIPYTSSFAPNGSGEIEVVIQAANYADPRDGGIVRSIKFGAEEAIARETQLSVSMQQLVAVVFLLHAVYAFILFFVGNRDRKLIYFSLLLVSATLMHLLGSEEKLLSYWTPIDYEWGFKLVHFSMVAVGYGLLQSTRHLQPEGWRKFIPIYSALCAGAAFLSLLLPVRHLVTAQPAYALIMGVGIAASGLSVLFTSIKELKENVLLLLSLVAFNSHFGWWGIHLATGIKTVYYPFDLIVSIACFASVWFRGYFQVHAETKMLAAKLQSADKRKDEFLANTSHELRNPLHSILNLSQGVLERERSLGGQSAKDLETVLNVGRRMSFMLNDLLDAMSLKENAPRLQIRSISVRPIAVGVMDMLRFMAEGKAVRLTVRIPERFPQVNADENRIVQILFNLLHNALKFTAEGEIAIGSYVENGRAYISVTDTGIGMDEEMARRAFEPYEQGDSGKRMIEGGFGLGLGISKQLAALHGGELRVRSVPGQGSEFVFSLPLAERSDAEEEPANAAASAEAAMAEASAAAARPWPPEPSGKVAERPPYILADRPRILAVDDDPVNLKVIETLLSSEDYDVATVASGAQALAALDDKEWDLVIADVMMPHMSGYELTRAIRARFSLTELPVLLLTARGRPEDIECGFRSGANDYAAKPVDASEIRSRVKALTEVKQAMRERLLMEAAWLQAQIQPHFLFNTLNAVSALSEIDLDRMRKLLKVFGDFLRDKYKLKNMHELVPVEEELSIVRSYLYIEQERFEDRLRIVWEIDEEDCKDIRIPLLTIQPLVENSVRHGILKRSRGGTITIRIANFGGYAEVAVEDDGVGMDEATLHGLLEKRSDVQSGVGLLNTDLRLKRHYGKGLRIKSEPDFGTSVSFNVFRSV